MGGNGRKNWDTIKIHAFMVTKKILTSTIDPRRTALAFFKRFPTEILQYGKHWFLVSLRNTVPRCLFVLKKCSQSLYADGLSVSSFMSGVAARHSIRRLAPSYLHPWPIKRFLMSHFLQK